MVTTKTWKVYYYEGTKSILRILTTKETLELQETHIILAIFSVNEVGAIIG